MDQWSVRLVEEHSPLLSAFYGREVLHGACVIVPDDYNPNRETPYPVVFWIGGFSSDHYGGRFMKSLFGVSDYDDQICRVVLNAQFHGGHHVFADSANTGPRMTALISEFIPYLEQTFNIGGSPSHRYLAGHSSLQTTQRYIEGDSRTRENKELSFSSFNPQQHYKGHRRTFR